MFVRSGRLDAFVLWIEHKFDDDISISNGPLTDSVPIEPGKKVSWDIYTRQAVCFVKKYFPLNLCKDDKLYIDSIFQSKSRDILLNASVTSGEYVFSVFIFLLIFII